jgi:hypothetical protein
LKKYFYFMSFSRPSPDYQVDKFVKTFSFNISYIVIERSFLNNLLYLGGF